MLLKVVSQPKDRFHLVQQHLLSYIKKRDVLNKFHFIFYIKLF